MWALGPRCVVYHGPVSRPRLTNQYICRFHHPHYCMSCFYRCCLTFRHSSLLSIILNKFLTSMHFIVYNSIITFVEITEKFDGRFTFDCYYLTCVITWIRWKRILPIYWLVLDTIGVVCVVSNDDDTSIEPVGTWLEDSMYDRYIKNKMKNGRNVFPKMDILRTFKNLYIKQSLQSCIILTKDILAVFHPWFNSGIIRLRQKNNLLLIKANETYVYIITTSILCKWRIMGDWSFPEV